MKQLSIVSSFAVLAVFSFTVWAGGPTALATHETGAEHGITAKSAEVFTPEILKAKDLIGMKVENPKTEKLGSIEDIVLTRDRNRVAYAVLSLGGTMGIGEKYYAVPWPAIARSGSRTLILNKDRAALRQAPGFDKANWPDMAKSEWARVVHEFYGLKHEPEPIAPATLTGAPGLEERRVSKLINMDVKSRQGQRLGEIRDIAIDAHRGDVVYGIISLAAPVPTTGAEVAVVPWTSLAIEPRTRTAQLAVDKSVLEAVAFRETAFPDLADREFGRRTYEQFNRQPYWDVLGYTAPGPAHKAKPGVMKDAWAAGSAYNRMFDPSKVSTISGTIESVGSFVPEKGARSGIEVSVRTGEGKSVTVQLGPHPFMRSENMLPAIGDRIQIKGSMAEVNGQKVCLACEFEKGGTKLELRDSHGVPAWEDVGSLRVRRTMEPKY